MSTSFRRRHFAGGAVGTLALGLTGLACAPQAIHTNESRRELSMSDQRIDPYTWPHKSLRRLLFDVTTWAGSVDVESASAMRELRDGVFSALDVVDAHAKHEETFLHPVLATKLPDFVRELDDEHRASRREVEELRQLLGAAVESESTSQRKEASLTFYRAVGRFVGDYLEHLDVEEAALPTYWARFSAEELAEVMRRFHVSRGPADAILDLERMLPALTPFERNELLLRMHASAPPDALRAACAAARRVLDAGAFARLEACIGVP
jgi:hypothetical protein